MIYFILETAKLIAWLVIIGIAIYRYRQISVNIFWLSVISAFLMAIGSVDDIFNYDILSEKSGWWLVANLFIIINYFVILRRSWRFYGKTKKKLTDFVEQIEKDRKELTNDK